MRSSESLLWDAMKSHKKVGDTITVNETDYTVVDDESFAIEVIREISSVKYLYELGPVIFYVAHEGIIPEDLDNCIEIVQRGLSNLGWTVNK